MADITTLSTDWTAPRTATPRATRRTGLAHRLRVLHRRARRDVYLANLTAAMGPDRAADLGIGTGRRYPWFETMFRAMGSR